MVSELAPGLKRRRVVRRVFAVVGIAGAVATALAFRAFFARPGENALRLIPKDAIVVGTADLSPSPNQTLVFKKLDDAFTRNGLDKHLDGALTDTVAQGNVAEKLRPFAKRAAAFALLAPEKKEAGDEPQMIAYFGISDGAEVTKILKQSGKKKFWKGTQYYVLNAGGPGLMVVEDMLAVSPSGSALHQTELIAEGKAPSILERPDFVAERQKIDPDSNLMVFVSPEALSLFAKDGPKEMQDSVKPMKWLSLGVAIRDGGIALSASGTLDQDAKWMKDLAQVAPLRSDLLAVLPKGAYAVNAISQPSKYFTSFENAMGDDPEGKKAIKEMEKGLAKDLNISLRQDVLPAFQGNAVAALYPSESSEKVGGIDVLVVIDDQNGAKAGPLAERLREAAEQSLAENGNDKNPFEVSTDGDIKKYRLVGEAEDSLHDSLAQGDDEVFNTELLAKDKTVTWAIVGNTVIASSSSKLLDRAIANLKAKTDGLNADALWSPYEKTLLDGSQTISAFNVSRLAEGFENTLHIDKMGDSKDTVQEVVDALKTLKEPFRIQAKTTAGESTMKLFIPMDYDKLIDMIGKAVNSGK